MATTTLETDSAALRDDLIELSHELGLEARQFALLGEGNVSVTCGDGTFWVKASGGRLETLGVGGVSRVRLEPIINLMERDSLSEREIEAELVAALIDATHKKPSVETFLHALCLSEGGASWVGHTHTVSVNQILCSSLGAEPFRRHIFPDAVVVCGLHPAVVSYVDPGFELAKAVRSSSCGVTAPHTNILPNCCCSRTTE